jgi:hypothetical protein
MRKTNPALLVGLFLSLTTAAADLNYEGGSSPLAWSELTSKQRSILAPLQATWDRMDGKRRQKWVRIARRYPDMTSSQQQRLRQRMSYWASLSPQDRSAAREKYRKFRQLPPGKHREIVIEWARYQRFVARQPGRQETADRN